MTNLQQKLIDAGYKKHVSESYVVFHGTNTLFQKCIWDEHKKEYYINCWYYPEQTINSHTLKENIQFEVQYRVPNNEVMDVTLSEKDIDKAERMFRLIWLNMECDYYDIGE